MQAGGVTVTDAYNVSGRVLVNGQDIGASVQAVSVERDIPSGLPGDSGFTSASGRVTAIWGDEVSDRVDHPWSADPLWPPAPNATVEVILSDGSGREWTQFKGVVVDPEGSTSTRVISFGVRDNYRSLDRLVTIPAMSDAMPSVYRLGGYRWVGMQSTFIADMLLRAAGRYCTPPPQGGWVVSATMQGSTWPERGTITSSEKDVPDGGTVSFPNWVNTDYGLAVQNVSAVYEPNIWSGTPGDGRITRSQFEMTQEVIQDSPSTTWLRARFANGGQVALVHLASGLQARYYPPSGDYTVLVSAFKEGAVRATARFRVNNSVLTAQLRTLSDSGEIVDHGTETMNVGSGLDGVLEDVRANGEGAQGAFQAAFTPNPFDVLDFTPNAVIHAAQFGRNSLVGVKAQINENILDLLNQQADAEFAQWWIDEHDILQWWDRGLLSQQPIAGVLTGQDHVRELSWSHSHDGVRHQVHVKYQAGEVEHRYQTNLTLWQHRGDTLNQGDTAEIFVNVPDDEIWLGVDTDPNRYGRTGTNWENINRGVGTVVGGIAVNGDGDERRTNSIVVSLRKVTDRTYVFDHDIRSLGSGEQAALEFQSDSEAGSSLWRRWDGEKLPILRGKKIIRFQDELVTSELTGDTNAPDYTHDHGWWIQTSRFAGQTADFAASSLTQPRPRVEGLQIMPVLALQVGDRIRVSMPDVAELDLTGVVTSNNLDADLDAGVIQQSISLMPTDIHSTAQQWQDFGHVFGGTQWRTWAQTTSNTTWADFGNTPLN